MGKSKNSEPKVRTVYPNFDSVVKINGDTELKGNLVIGGKVVNGDVIEGDVVNGPVIKDEFLAGIYKKVICLTELINKYEEDLFGEDSQTISGVRLTIIGGGKSGKSYVLQQQLKDLNKLWKKYKKIDDDFREKDKMWSEALIK
ncbi:hypothetical protein H8D04_00490 [bacterium]|nr:hypothetical protein [bacterium]